MEELTDSIVDDAKELIKAVKGELSNFTIDQLQEIRDAAYIVLHVATNEVNWRH